MSFHSVPSAMMLDVLCPMHVALSKTGHITHAGPTLRKLRPGQEWIGLRFLEVFRLLRPHEVTSMVQLGRLAGQKLHLELREPPGTALKAVAMHNPQGDGFVVNMSFGMSVIDAVRDFELSSKDFAPTDLTIEMLYLVEAKSAAMEASRKLTNRLQGAKAAAEKQAFTDALTGLKNRRAMDMGLARLMSTGEPFSMMHVDLDFFKEVNDSLGHAAGDYVLSQVAEALRAVTRQLDLIARVGGDEFVILMPGLLNRGVLESIGQRLIEALEEPMEFNDQTCRISGSIGTVIWDGHTRTNPDVLLDDADVALYASKNAGRGCQTFYEPNLREAERAKLPPRSAGN